MMGMIFGALGPRFTARGSGPNISDFHPRPRLTQTDHSIEARGLTKFFGAAAAIKNISFTVEPGEVVGFLGPNGAGKSTTLRILSGLLRADRGEAYIAGVSVARFPNRIKKLIGYMPENNPLPEDLRVIEYLRRRASLKGLRGSARRQRIDDVLDICDLQRTARRKLIGALSKGYRQRVGLADAILGHPAVTILDEPTIGLDPHQILQIRKLIDSLRGKTTVILSSHILAEVEISCDRVIILNRGVIVATGAPQALRREFFPGRRYEVEIAGPPEALDQVASGIGVPCTIERAGDPPDDEGFRRVLLTFECEDDCGERLLSLLGTHPTLRVRHFRADTPTLEDIFLAATRRSWEIESELPKRPPEAAAPMPS